MSFDKTIQNDEGVEIEIVDDGTPGTVDISEILEPNDEFDGAELVEMEDGSVEINPKEIAEQMIMGAPFDANLAEYLSDNDLDLLANDQVQLFEEDMNSRREWTDIFTEGMDVLGLRYEKRSEPWEDACGAYSSVLTEAAIRFQAEAMSETFPAKGPVKTKILGEETPESKKAADRVAEDMNYQITEVMTEYRPEHERMLWSLGLTGSAFKKVFDDPALGRPSSLYISAEDVIVPYGESVIEHSPRVTHVMRVTDNYIKRLQKSGFYDPDADIGEGIKFESDVEEIKQKKAEEDGFTITHNDDGRRPILEMHVDLAIEGLPESEGGLEYPYILTIDKSSNKVLALYRNWRQNDSHFKKQQHLVHYSYVPGFGFYGLGLIHLVGGYARSGTSLIRQLVDAGTLSNLPGGLKSRDLRNSENDNTPISPGEWRDVNVPSGAIRDHVMALPYGEPSPTLLNLLDKITSEGRRMGGIAEINISDMSANAPVGTVLALLEQMLKPMSAVQSRLHHSMKMEFKLLKKYVAASAPSGYGYSPIGGDVNRTAKQADYSLVEVIPVSDPNSSTMAQRIVQWQTVMQMAKDAPNAYDIPMLHRQMIETIGVKNAEKIVALPEDATPRDPVSENMGVLTAKPLKAFMYQDHEAHIKAHMTFLQDPMIMQTVGQTPMAQQAMAALQAHIAEHLGFSYRRQMEEALGAPLPPPDEPLDEQLEVNLSRLVADGGAMLTQMHQAQAAQQKAKQAEEDPHLQLERFDAETKRQEVARKSKKDAADIDVRNREQDRKASMDIVDSQLELENIAQDRRDTELRAQQAGQKLQNEREALDSRIDLDLIDKFLQSRPTPIPTAQNTSGNSGSDQGSNQ